jgi:IS605 OrfB family transposase
MVKQFFAQVNRLPEDNELKAVLEYLCTESNKLYNCAIYLARQLYFKTGKISNGHWLSTVMKNHPHAKSIYASAAQQTCISVGEAFKGFKVLSKLWSQGSLPEKPKPPKYRKSGLFQISYPKKWLKFTDNGIRVPLGTSCKVWFNLQYIYLPFPSNLIWSRVKELQIVPRAGYFDAVWITSEDIEPIVFDLNPNNFLALDPGLDNWLTAVSNVGTSFIVDGKHLKSLNQWYNKRIATIKEQKSQGFWCKLLDQTTEKRNRQMRDAVNKAARLVIDHCLDNKIGTVIFGWNRGQKQQSSMGRKNNQKFVSVPTAKLKSRIQQLGEQNGLRFVETEESYTSKSDSLALDAIPKYGEKPEEWKPSGKRITRGQYKSKTGLIFNADLNGALNIARKVTSSLGIDFNPNDLARGVLTSPKRLRIWDVNFNILSS